MFLLILSIIQSQQPRLSPVVIAVAALAFILGVSLLIYFFRRMKTSEKEVEEDWALSRRSLFVNPEPVGQKTEEAAAEPAPHEHVDQAATRELASARVADVPEASTERVVQQQPATEVFGAVSLPAPEMSAGDSPAIIEERPHNPKPEPQPAPEARPTEVLTSPQPLHVTEEAGTAGDVAHFDDDVWAGLEIDEPQSPPAPPPARVDRQTQLFGSSELWRAKDQPSTEQVGKQTQPPVESAETRLGARVEHPAGREPFEPPIIKPLTPREELTFTGKQRVSPAPDDLYASSAHDRKGPADETVTYGASADRQPAQSQQRHDAQSLYEDNARPVESASPSNTRPASADRPTGSPAAVGHAGGVRSSPAGSILGLPAEASYKPLILGDPARSKEERGIGALSNYGRPLEKDGGRGGTVALLVVVLIIGGGLLAYLLIPSVHSRANAFVAHLRGTDVEEARRVAMTPKATIYPRVGSEVNKNQVKIKGAVDNIWNEPLENLSVEVALQRGGDAPPQTIKVAVSPNPLPPNQRGSFDFEYDGKRDTGFVGYKITKLFSNDNEIKFTSPNAQK
ncbi:MAG: hypothetical protein ACLGJB_12325 [Blastocatellia bacterium]